MRQQRQLDRWQEGWEGSSSKEQESRVMDGEERGSTRGEEDKRMVQVVTMVGAGGVGGSGKEQESRAEEVAGHNQYRKVVGPCIIHVSLKVSSKYFL